MAAQVCGGPHLDRDGEAGLGGGPLAPRGAEVQAVCGGRVAVYRKHGKPRRWRFVTAGSSFDCGPLYKQVPVAVVQDLGITCV